MTTLRGGRTLLPELDPKATLDAALQYRGQGCSVIPLVPHQKRAALDTWKPYQTMLADPNKLIDWFEIERRNIAIVTGEVSQIVVLDVDNLDGLAKYPELPETVTVKTGKGRHYYFNAPVGLKIPNAKIDGLGDLKSDGGYVVAPPSIHPDTGKRYEWESEIGKASMADMPDWLVKLATAKREPREPMPDELHEIKTTRWGSKWHEDVAELASALQGSRNDLLNKVACKAGSLIAARQLNEAEAWEAMENACRRNGLARDDGMPSVTQTIRSGLSAGKENPRHPMKAEETVPVFEGGKLQLRRASTITAEKIDWLWKGVLAKGHISLVAGDAGTGKSSLALSLAAIVSTGGTWPVTGEKAEPGNVIILNREDRAEDVIVPRLMAAGANLDRVFIVGDVGEGENARDFDLARDLPKLAEACRDIGQVSYIVIDPVGSYMGSGDMNKQSDVRQLVTNPLVALAQEYMASVLMITHNNKSSVAGASAKVLGSGAWVQSARTVFSVTKDDETGIRTMAPAKVNIANDTVAYCYTTHAAVVGNGIETSHVRWENSSMAITADQVLADKQDGPMMAIAKEFLTETVQHHRLPSSEVTRLANQRGISAKTLSRAKKALLIKSDWDQQTSQFVYVWPSSEDLERGEQTIAPFAPVF